MGRQKGALYSISSLVYHLPAGKNQSDPVEFLYFRQAEILGQLLGVVQEIPREHLNAGRGAGTSPTAESVSDTLLGQSNNRQHYLKG